MSVFGENFNRILNERKITQTQIAECLQVKPNTVNQWAHGKRDPDFDMLAKICMLLGTTPDAMLGYEEIKQRYFQGFIRDVIGNDRNFQREQMGMLDSMQELGQDAEMKRADEALFDRYVAAYRAKFGF